MALASKTGEVKFVRKGRPGAVPYPCGSHDSNTTYKCTETTAPFVEQEGQYYLMSKVGSWRSNSVGRTPKDDYARYGQNATWILMDKMKALVTEMFFTNFAKLGSAIFYGDYMYSQYGRDSQGSLSTAYHNFNPDKIGQSDCPFSPEVMIDWVRGTLQAMDVKIKGEIRAKRMYIEYVLFPNGTRFWDLDTYTSNIRTESTGDISRITMPDSRTNSGIMLNVLCLFHSRSSTDTYLVAGNGDTFRYGIVGYSYYLLPQNLLTQITSAGSGWLILNPVPENFKQSI